MAFVTYQWDKVSALCWLACRLLRWMEGLDVHLDARYLPGQFYVLADSLSRREHVVGTEWSLHPRVGSSPLRVWGNPSIDFCPTSLNMTLPLYCSLIPDPQTNFEDAFCHPCFGWVFAMRSPFEGRDCFMSQFSIVTKTPLSFTWFRAFAMGSPFEGRVCIGELPHSIGMKSLSEPYSKFLRDGVTLWVGCGPRSTLDHERRIFLEVSPSSFRMGSPC